MLSIIYPYRDRDLERLRRSLDSLQEQSSPDFQVFLVDYGSEDKSSESVKQLGSKYDFLEYNFLPTQFQPWNKSKALNSIIRKLQTNFCLVADVDMIFYPDFVKRAKELQQPNRAVYFQVGFLDPAEKIEQKKFNDLTKYRKSTREVTGITMFPVTVLQELRGFDEFYHFWGAEDTDIHVRLRNAGYEVEFYDKDVLLLHQWHPSYRSRETDGLSRELQIKGIVELNHQHLKSADLQKITTVNSLDWGVCIRRDEVIELEKAAVDQCLSNKRAEIDELLHGQLPQIKNEILKVKFGIDPYIGSRTYKIKKFLGKKVPRYYSLKEINDKLLLHLISFYRNCPYSYKVREDLKEIEIAIKL